MYLTNVAYVICFYDLCDRFEYTGLIYPFLETTTISSVMRSESSL